ncbi:hypothetical protein FNYG_11478 [Fusarium nygamai]|uniref:Uncharacterized protein n=1 Tax=Gibberella nygamai TaxID=42673 RepID=A0A2K0VZ77_GIBNY|nr:hypothetical protein FNYG_11478 [Fusarium nygamai]
MSTPEYRTPHTVASTNRTLRNAFSALNMHYSGDEEESESDGSPKCKYLIPAHLIRLPVLPWLRAHHKML